MGSACGNWRGANGRIFLQPVEPPFVLAERMELDAPVELLDSLLFVVAVMLDQLILRAQARILALAAVTVSLSLDGGGTYARTVRPALPSNEKQLWIKLLHLDLEAHPPHAAIVGVALTAEPGKTGKVQLGLFSPQLPEPSRLDVTLARIRAIVGDGNCGRAVLDDTHSPEAFRMEPFALSASGRRADAAPSSTRMAHAAAAAAGADFCSPRITRGRRRLPFAIAATRWSARMDRGLRAANGGTRRSGTWRSGTWWRARRTVPCSAAAITRDPARNLWEVAALYD